jgi:Kef-type K+ transport system membrane component KefB
MADLSDNWSKQRQIAAQRVSAILYGVVAVITAELSVRAGEYSYFETALGAIVVGFAMTATRIFVEVVKKETEIGAHLPLVKAGAVVADSLLVMLFPLVTALLIVIAALTTESWATLFNSVLYVGIGVVFATGFVSSYILDRAPRPALTRGLLWVALCLVLVAAKKLA